MTQFLIVSGIVFWLLIIAGLIVLGVILSMGKIEEHDEWDDDLYER